MAANIKATMGIDGASKFKSDLNSAKQSVKELDSELKLAESQFKATGDEQQYMSDRSSILKQQLDAQESVVKLLNDQLKTAAEKYGENSTKVSKLKTELNKAKTSQNNMKSALNNAEKPLESAAEDADTLASKMSGAADNTSTLDENLQHVATHLDLQAVQNFANNISTAIEHAAKKAKDLAVQVWNLGTEAGSTADEWLTMSDQYGIPVEDIQKWSYAGRFIDTTLDNITGSMVKFRTKYSDVREAFDELTSLQNRRANAKGKTEIEELDKRIASLSEKALALKDNFGIDIYDAQHNLKSTADLYWEMIDVIGNAYNNGNQELAEQAAMDWFGRSAANLNPLFKAGKDAFMELGEEAEQMGYIMSSEDVSALGAFDDQTQKLEASINTLKLQMAEDLLPLLQKVADGFLQISDGILKYLQSDEGKAAITNMSEALGGILGNISDDIPGAIQTAIDYVTNFASGFGTAEEAVNKVITAVQTLAAVWAASKLVSFGASMIEASQTIGGFFGRLLAKHAPAAKETAEAGTAAATGATSKGILAGIGKFLTSTGAKIGGGTLVGITTLFEGVINDVIEDVTNQQGIKSSDRSDEIKAKAAEVGQTFEQAMDQIDWEIAEFGGTLDEAIDKYINGNLNLGIYGSDLTKQNTDASEQAEKLLDAASLLQAIVEGDRSIEAIDELDPNWVKNAFPDSLMAEILRQNGSAEAWAENMDSLFDWEYVRDAEVNMAQEMLDMVNEKMQNDGVTVGQAIDQSLANSLTENVGLVETAGENVAIGFANGINKGTDPVQKAARGLAASAISTLKSVMLISSPSRVMEQLGYYTSQGFANGIDGNQSAVTGAVNRMLGAATATPIYGTSGTGTTVSGTDGIVNALNGAVVVMDGETVGRLVFPYVNAEMGESLSRRYA